MSREIIAILRGITPDEALSAGEILINAGIDLIEVPMNSPDALLSIEMLVAKFGHDVKIGAGTVLNTDTVDQLANIGASLIVSPNMDVEVIEAAKSADMLSYPGVMTPTECFAAIKAGADGLKFFPGELVGPIGLKAMRAVLPPDIKCYAVGGARPENFAEWKAAGANGFGIGSALYKPNMTLQDMANNAAEIVRAYDAVM